MSSNIEGPIILISSDSEDDDVKNTTMTIIRISDSPSPPSSRNQKRLNYMVKKRTRPRFGPKGKKLKTCDTIHSGPIIIISDEESETPARAASPAESTKENKAFGDLLELNFDDINDPEKLKTTIMEASLPYTERHTLSPKNSYYPRISGSPNKYSPIKRTDKLKCIKPNSINTKSRNIRRMNSSQNITQVQQVFHEKFIKPKDSFPNKPLGTDVIVKRAHIPHSQLLYPGLPNHLVKDIYRSERSHVNAGRKLSVRGFSNIHNNIIDAYMEEGIEVEGVMFIRDSTTMARKPEGQCLKYLLDTLMATGGGRGLTCQIYGTLKHIQHHHKLSIKDFPEDWNEIMKILNPLVYDTTNLSNRNRLLYLDLLTTVFEEDLHQCKLDNKVKESFVFIMLCPDHRMSNLSKIINLLLNISKRTDMPEDIFHRVIFLLQKIIAISLDVCKSAVEGAMRIAEDILYPFRSLLNADNRKQVLETIQSDVLRLKLIELWLENCHFRDHNDNIPHSAEPISISKIVNRHFTYKPSEDFEDRSLACEELSMVLYLLLKSYLGYTAGKVSPSPKDSATCFCSLQLSIEDKTWLVGIGDIITSLRYHLSSFADLTPKTLMNLNYIEVLQDLVDI